MTPKTKDIEAIIAFSQTVEGRQRVLDFILKSGLPLYSTDPACPGFILQTSRDGTVLKGHMVQGKFVAEGGPLPRDNEIAAFQRVRLRSIGSASKILAREGGAVPADEFAMELKLSLETVGRLRRAGKIFGVKHQGRYVYPRFQIKNRKLLPGLSEVLGVFTRQSCSGMGTLLFFLTPAEALDDETPLALLRRGEVEEAKMHAERSLLG